jgi:hypothetical protein
MSTTPARLLDPDWTFDRLSHAYAQAGWQVVDQSSVPILAGEPEFAVLEHGPDRVVYTFNPVCALRLLDVTAVADPATLPETPEVGVDAVRAWLGSADERTVLRGVLAGGELGDPDLAAPIEAHVHHPRAAIADAAVRATARLAEGSGSVPFLDEELATDLAQAEALVAIDALRDQLAPLLRALAEDRSGRLVAELRPQPQDAARAFVLEAVEAARSAYDRLWSQPVRLTHASASDRLLIHIAPAGMLTFDNELSHPFPSGYRSVAPLLQPQRVWVAWKLVPAGASAGMAYDGLVWLEDHWAWFPKPYRALSDLVSRRPEV